MFMAASVVGVVGQLSQEEAVAPPGEHGNSIDEAQEAVLCNREEGDGDGEGFRVGPRGEGRLAMPDDLEVVAAEKAAGDAKGLRIEGLEESRLPGGLVVEGAYQGLDLGKDIFNVVEGLASDALDGGEEAFVLHGCHFRRKRRAVLENR
jgi:hypothetical protein